MEQSCRMSKLLQLSSTLSIWLCCKNGRLVVRKRVDLPNLYFFIFCLGGLLLSKSDQNSFKRCHSHSEVILMCVRWYLRYALSYRDLEEMMKERNFARQVSKRALISSRSAGMVESITEPP